MPTYIRHGRLRWQRGDGGAASVCFIALIYRPLTVFAASNQNAIVTLFTVAIGLAAVGWSKGQLQ